MARLIELTKGKLAIVDEADYDELMRFTWHALWSGRSNAIKKWYAKNSDGGYMHRMLMGFPDSKVDHRDGNGLNNCRSNLRIGGNAGNARNRKRGRSKSGYVGVWFEPPTGRWVADIMVDYRRMKVGRYATAEEAARARDDAARRLHGEFAVLNFG